jgi:hypothetical protein
MTVRKLKHHGPLPGARDEIRETHDQCQSHELTQGHVATCVAQLARWDVVYAQELALKDGINAAKVRIFWANRAVNHVAGRVSKAIFTVVGDDRTQPLYVAYFGDMALGEWKRTPLKDRIEKMGGWSPQLTGSDVPALVALEPAVKKAVDEAKDARKAHATLEQEQTYFREVGDRKKFFDTLNAERKEMYGEIAKLPFLHLGLPSDFASFFFLRAPEKKEEAATIESVQETIANLERQLADQKELLADLEAEAAEEEKKAAELQAKRALAEQLEKEAVEAELQAKAKRAKIAELGV